MYITLSHIAFEAELADIFSNNPALLHSPFIFAFSIYTFYDFADEAEHLMSILI